MVTLKCVWCGEPVQRVTDNPHGMVWYEGWLGDCSQSSSGSHDIADEDDTFK